MNFIKENLNPSGKEIGDCVVRSVSKALNKRWVDVLLDLANIGAELYTMPNTPATYIKYLELNGFKKQPMPKEDGRRITLHRFAQLNPKGTYVVSIRRHLATVKDGTLYDTWNCGHYCIGNYFKRT